MTKKSGLLDFQVLRKVLVLGKSYHHIMIISFLTSSKKKKKLNSIKLPIFSDN